MNLQQLPKYLLSTCRYIQSESGVEAPAQPALWVEWVVARSLCCFRPLDVSAIAARELDVFIQMQLREWAPFDEPEHYVKLYGNIALVWVWDGGLRRRLAAEAGVTPDIVAPESVLRGAEPASADNPVDNTVDLVSCIDGYEGRGFRGSRQLASRWWRQLPDAVSWAQFNMLMDVVPGTANPGAADVPLQPASAASTKGMLISFLRKESTLFIVSCALFLVVAAYQLAGIGYAAATTASTEDKIAELNVAITPVLAARDEAMLALDTIQEISALHAGPLQLQYITDLLERLAAARAAGQDVSLMAWEYRQDDIAISVTSPELTAAELLGLFEAIPWLDQQRVADDPVKGRMKITAELVPGWVFAPGAEDKVAGS